MTCTACQHANRDTARFCENCGAPLARRCPACGTAARPGARFCDQCGHTLAAPIEAGPSAAPATGAARLDRQPIGYTPKHLAEKILTTRSAVEGERKQVTVLFADCVGFTELSSRLDPEELHRIMDGCFQCLLDAVHRYEGTVNQFTGDGVMALFGAPIAHEDHAARAVGAALAAQQALTRYADFLRQDCGIELAVRIGLNTGLVVVGKIGDDLRMDYTAQGETVNLAARLQAAAPAGGVLITEATYRLVGGLFETRDVGELSVKGLAQPVPAFTVLAQRGALGRFDLALERGLTPLVGRGPELEFLRNALERARGGRGQVVSVVGEAGVGKSRLVWEFRRQVEGAELSSLAGRCLPPGASVPFHPVVTLLRTAFGVREGEDERSQVEKVAEGVRRLDPALGWAVPYAKHLLALPVEELEADGLDPHQRKRRMTEAVKALVLGAAQRTPLLLVVEDLQWIDQGSEEFCRALVDSLAGHRILIIATYRTGYAPAWQDRSVHQRLALEPLSREESAGMAHGLLGAAGLAPAAAASILDRAEGNPFFIEELARYLRDSGAVGRDIPATVQDLLAARIDRLAEGPKRTLQIASVLGRDFSLGLLEAVAPPESDVKSDLGELVRQELVLEKDLFPEPAYSFSQILVQEVAYQGLLVKARGGIHARAGAALERLCAGRLEEVLAQVAEHYHRSPDRDKAHHYLLRAGDRAASLFAWAEAGSYYGRALAALPPERAAAGRRAVVLERLGDVAFAAASVTEALDRWSEALAIIDGTGDRPRTADLHRKIAEAHWGAARKDDALAHLERGLDALGGEVENLAAARLYQECGRIHFRLGDLAEATEWATRALALGMRLGAPDVVSHAYNTLGVARARAGDMEGGAEYVGKSLETALAHQLGSVACRAYTNLAVMLAPLDHERSAEYCREGLRLAEQIGDQLQQAWLYCALAGGHCTLAGDYDEGVRAAESAIELDERLGQRGHLPIPLIILAQVYQCRGDFERSGAVYRRALAVAEALGEPQLLVPCYEGLATLAIESGDEERATAWLEKSRRVQEAAAMSSDTFLVLPFLC